MSDAARIERATGALVGAVVGDALGAPFEFGSPGEFSQAFPTRVLLDPGEMIGNRAWEPAEWTDDSQMGLLLAQSLLERGGLDEGDIFERFRRWVAGGPKDVGIQTRTVLTSDAGWAHAAPDHFASTGHAAGNGSLMRTVPAALYFADAGAEQTMDAARRISMLTHGDPAAGEGCAIYHELIRVALDGRDPLDHIDDALALVDPTLVEPYAARLGPDYDPHRDDTGNGAVWPALGQAVWALRTTDSFEECLRAVIDLGHDTDTVACIAGGLAGARYSIGAIPSRWTVHLHGSLVGHRDSGIDLEALEAMARSLLTHRSSSPADPPREHVVEPTRVWDDDLIYAASYPGVVSALDAGRLPDDAVIISLSRTFGRLDAHRHRRQVWMVDQDGPGRNSAIQDVLDDVVDTMTAAVAVGRPVIVHCHGGRSRTGLILRAWLLSRHPTMTLAEATADVAAHWPHLDLWNESFTAALETWSTRRRRP